MKKLSLIPFFLISSILLPLSLFCQGPIDGYMKPKGEFNFAPSYAFEEFTEFYLGETQLQPGISKIHSVSTFFAYGLSPKWNIIAGVPYLKADEINKGLQDGYLFGKYLIGETKARKGNINWMTAAGVFAPLSKYQTDSLNALGQRAVSLEGKLIAQYQNRGFFTMLLGGYNYKLGDPPSSVQAVFKTGLGTNKYYLDAWVEYLYSMGGLDLDSAPSGTDFRLIGTGHLKIGGTVYIPLDEHIGFFVNAAQIINGRNTGKSTRFGVGFNIKFSTLKSEGVTQVQPRY